MFRVLATTLMLLFAPSVQAATPDLHLPFMAGDDWWCAQGWNGSTSHVGEAAWDYNYMGGQDLGYPVVAPASGSVVFAGRATKKSDGKNSPYGNVVLIDYGDGYYGRLAHLSGITVRVSEQIQQGQVVGFCGGVGATDNQWSPHIHNNTQRTSDPAGQDYTEVYVHYRKDNQNLHGYPEPCDCTSNPGDKHYVSLNSHLLDLEFTTNGGAPKFGDDHVNPGIHWYHLYDANNLYHADNPTVPNNCYVQNFSGGEWGNCGIVYDALGGARRAYTVRTGFWQNTGQHNGWADLEGPRSSLGMPVTNEYETDPGYVARQDFQLGWLNYNSIGSVVAVHTYSRCAPGWTSSGWDPTISYRLAQKYEDGGARNHYGEAVDVAYLDGDTWRQQFDHDAIALPPDDVNGQGGPELPTITPFFGDWDGNRTANLGVYDDETTTFSLDTNGNGATDLNLWYSTALDIPLSGDWNGDGRVTVGLFRPAYRAFWFDDNQDGVMDWGVVAGADGDLPLAGDWNRDGTTDIGLYRPGERTFYLDHNKDGSAEVALTFGDLGDLPLVGDWDGDGDWTIGLYRPSTRMFYLDFDNNALSDRQCTYGDLGDVPIAGDWDGDGRMDTGVYQSSTQICWLDIGSDGYGDQQIILGKVDPPPPPPFAERTLTPFAGDWNSTAGDEIGVYADETTTFSLDTDGNGATDLDLAYSAAIDEPLSGDWNGDGRVTVGLYRPAYHAFWFDDNQDGVMDWGVVAGADGDLPLSGDWDGNGTTDIGLYRPGERTFYLDHNKDGSAEVALTFGDWSDIPITGDWDGDGDWTIGLYRPSTRMFYLDLDNDHLSDRQCTYGDLGDLPVCGDWDGNGTTDIGVYRPSTQTCWLDIGSDGYADRQVVLHQEAAGAGDTGSAGKTGDPGLLELASKAGRESTATATRVGTPADRTAPAGMTLTLTPNPSTSTSGITFFLTLPSAGRVTVQILDVRGTLLAVPLNRSLPAGTHQSVLWKGVDNRGSPLAAGVYVARCHSAAGTVTARFILLP